MYPSFVSLDIETTGTKSGINAIVQISAEYHKDGKVINTFNKSIRVDSDSEIDLSALKYNGLKLNEITNHMNPSIKDALFSLVDWLLDLNLDKNTFILGTNVDFDIQFLVAELKKYNIVGWDSLISYRKRDLSTVWAMLIDSGLVSEVELKSKGTVAKMAEFFDIKVDGKLHDSRVDVMITSLIYYAALNYLSNLKKEK